MTFLAWTLVGAAIVLQLLNVVWFMQGISSRQAKSQVVLVPCLLWYIALVIRGEGFFASSSGIEIGVVVIVHLFLTGAMAAISSRLGSAS
ncbi:MAG: hypothetical protein IPG63_08140 [Xanthomonadales bacterium]|nr:hypothetical protein [Xanthomonadales bacterium]MBK7144403.1 hypothetical protein [Xanthomonadales bacterium]